MEDPILMNKREIRSCLSIYLPSTSNISKARLLLMIIAPPEIINFRFQQILREQSAIKISNIVSQLLRVKGLA